MNIKTKEALILARMALKNEVCNTCTGKIGAEWAAGNCRYCLVYPALKRINECLREW